MRKTNRKKWLGLAGLLALWLIGVVGIGLGVYLNPTPGVGGAMRANSSAAEVVASVFTALGGLSVVLTLYFYIWQTIETNERHVIENTFNLLESWDHPALLAARRFTRELGDRHAALAPTQLVDEVNQNPELRQSAIQLFNFIERVGLSIRTERVDANIIRRAMTSSLTALYQRFLPWIEFQNTRIPGYKLDLEQHIDLLRGPRGDEY